MVGGELPWFKAVYLLRLVLLLAIVRFFVAFIYGGELSWFRARPSSSTSEADS